jgi:hypothetical protein
LPPSYQDTLAQFRKLRNRIAIKWFKLILMFSASNLPSPTNTFS